MQMQPHHRIKRGAIEMEGEDRLSRLADDILHSILRGLPLKHAARTSALSRRWARTWLHALASSRVLDFTDRGFGRRQASARATVSCCLRLHAEHGVPLDVFRVALTSPPPGGAGAFERDVVGWVASAVARGAREVEVHLTPSKGDADTDDGIAAFVELPGDLFVATNSLERLVLGGFSLRAVPAGAVAGLAGLRSLSLSHADVTGEAVRDVVSGCRALEHLSLSSCSLLKSVRIASETLRVLEIVRELRVTAPALESFAFHGDTVYSSDYNDISSAVDLGSTPALRDAYLSHIGFDDDVNAYQDREYAYSNFLTCVAHARALTLCSVGLLHLWGQLSYDDGVEMDMTNIQELQLLLCSEGEDDDLLSFASFFQTNPLPLLDRLFVRLPSHATDASDAVPVLAGEVVDDSRKMIPGYEIVVVDSRIMIRDFDIVLDHLSFIKLVNFKGTRFELQLLAFLLKRAPALEQLVLVTVGEEGGAPVDEHIVQGWVSRMRKASPEPQLTVCRSSEDRSQNPVHTRFYHEEIVLDSLSFIKLVNFRGTRFELQLLAFLLKGAPALEQLVLVTVGEEERAPIYEHVVQGWVSEMPKASPEPQLTVCWSTEDRSQNPVHTRFYHELEE